MEPHPYAQALAEGDHEGLVAHLADDVTFHSPVIGGAAFEGRESTAALLEIVVREVRDVEYTYVFGDSAAQVLVGKGRVRGTPIDVTTLLEFDGEAKIREIWVMARPLVGVIAIAEAIGSGLAQRQAPSRARILAATTKPLVALGAATDRVGSRLIASLNRSVG